MTMDAQITIQTWKKLNCELQRSFVTFSHNFDDWRIHWTNLNQSWSSWCDYYAPTSPWYYFVKFLLNRSNIITDMQDLFCHRALVRRRHIIHLMLKLLLDLLKKRSLFNHVFVNNSNALWLRWERTLRFESVFSVRCTYRRRPLSIHEWCSLVEFFGTCYCKWWCKLLSTFRNS